MNLQTFQDFPKVLSIFLEFLLGIKCPQSFRIFFYEFTNTPGLPDGAKYFSRISTSHKKSPSFRIFFYEFTNTTGIPEVARYFSKLSTRYKMSPKLQNNFLWIYKHSMTSKVYGGLLKYFWSFRMYTKSVNKIILWLLAIQETFKNHGKIFGSLQDVLGLVKLQGKYLEPSGNPGQFGNLLDL